MQGSFQRKIMAKQGSVSFIDFQWSVESNPGLHWFYSTLHCDWSKKLVPSFNQSDGKLKQSRFPACFHFEFSSANDDVNLCFDWSL